jgi:hypothetical protein
MQVIDMKMDQIEFVLMPEYLIHLYKMMGQRID